ncbi:hypothetical protein [Flavobacterium sp. NKUCC04_CG]|uniref:hypothetical protein n=1 Tax=Flavobacterium sp. NKUCC04_CG TaxID=2842121 RepID=UPI001C5A75EA|nr:hypothetical protein [Flavobacterium sp. NKUCC04_CG]MBW3518392.1 hypothetical protein [Flavobacterium sp. NKUCC04_CG]
MDIKLPIINAKQIEQLIPQRAPIVMVDCLLSFGVSDIEAGLTVMKNQILVQEGYLQEAGVIEHMAQTVALHTGYDFFCKGVAAPVGYIGSIKEIVISRLPQVSEQMISKAHILQEFMGVTLVEVETFIAGVSIAKGQMKTVIAQ